MPVNIRHMRTPASAAILALPVLAAAMALAPAAAFAQAAEIQYRRPMPYAVELPPPEARGCYYHRGRRYCGAYCYWEVNGKRYCQRRERDAHSQAPIVDDYGDIPVMK
jgi:hypothetical protein